MRKFVTAWMALLMAASLVGCGGTSDNPQQSSSAGTNTDPGVQTEVPATENVSLPETGEITLDAVMNHPVSPESDFRCYETEDGTMKVVNYLGDEEIVVIPETWKGKPITAIGSFVFANDSPVRAIRLSDSVKEVMDSAFALNQSLQIFVCGSGMENIGVGAFQECVNLHTVRLNDGLKTIKGASFGGCKSLLELEIPESVTEIQPMTFYNGPEDLVIVGTAGSEAERFATSEGIEFQAK